MAPPESTSSSNTIEQDEKYWQLTYEGFEPEKEGLREALCTLGNGIFATRGACEMSHADGIHYPGTYYNGYFDRADTKILDRVVTNEDLVNFPNWLPLTFRIGTDWNSLQDGWHSLSTSKILQYTQTLDLSTGILSRKMKLEDIKGNRTSILTRRFIHMGERHLAAVEFTIIPENWSDKPLQIRSSLDAGVKNSGVARYKDLNPNHLDVLQEGAIEQEGELLLQALVKTKQSRIEVAQAIRTRVFVNDALVSAKINQQGTNDEDKQENNDDNNNNATVEWYSDGERQHFNHLLFTLPKVTQGQTIRVEKVMNIFTSRDPGISESLMTAIFRTKYTPDIGIQIQGHTQAWKALWMRSDVVILPENVCNEMTKGEPEDSVHQQLILRLHTFHCLQVLNTNALDRDVSCPPRGIHGEAYRGHIFWDELFIMPFYLLKLPEVARLIPQYRFRRLNMARILAKEKNYKGALFPWQSGSDGREETQLLHLNPLSGAWGPDNSRLQVHVNIAIAYNIFRYFNVTRDWDFAEMYGGEIVLEIAKMFDSITVYNEKRGRYEIHHVMGPDEFHEKYPGVGDDPAEQGLNNNAYTNIMVVWLFKNCLQMFEHIRYQFQSKLLAKLQITKETLDRWKDITKKMYVPIHQCTMATKDGNSHEVIKTVDIISQFEGYEKLKELDWEGYRAKYKNIHRLDRILKAEGDSPDNYKVSKQPDVCMLFYLLTPREFYLIMSDLGYSVSDDMIYNNIMYYLERTSHGSTLSFLVFASILYPIDEEKGWQCYLEALKSDIRDIQGGTTPEGIHLAIMAGTVDMVARIFAGVDISRDAISMHPCLPRHFQRIQFHLQYGFDCVLIDMTHDRVLIKPEKGSSTTFPVFIQGVLYWIVDEEPLEVQLQKGKGMYSAEPGFCKHCNKKIGFVERKFICRGCGEVFCCACKPQYRMPLQEIAGRVSLQPVRVCKSCYDSPQARWTRAIRWAKDRVAETASAALEKVATFPTIVASTTLTG